MPGHAEQKTLRCGGCSHRHTTHRSVSRAKHGRHAYPSSSKISRLPAAASYRGSHVLGRSGLHHVTCGAPPHLHQSHKLEDGRRHSTRRAAWLLTRKNCFAAGSLRCLPAFARPAAPRPLPPSLRPHALPPTTLLRATRLPGQDVACPVSSACWHTHCTYLSLSCQRAGDPALRAAHTPRARPPLPISAASSAAGHVAAASLPREMTPT